MTGEPTPYGDDDYWALVKYLAAAFETWPAEHGRMTIRADIEWAGEYNPRAHRTTTLFRERPLYLKRVRELTGRAMGLFGEIPKPYTVKAPNIPVTFSGQLNWLTGTKAGREHAAGAGFSPGPQTLRRWKAGTQKPSKKNREALIAAGERYHEQRHAEWEQRRDAQAARVSAGEHRFAAAARAVGDALTAEIREPARFFDISDLYFGG